METLYLGESPADEDCEQVGPNYSTRKAMRECKAYIAQLMRMFGPAPEGAFLTMVREAHDYGRYLTVVVKYEEGNEKAMEWAFNVEANSPLKWDEITQKGVEVMNIVEMVEKDALWSAAMGLGFRSNPFPKSNFLAGEWAAAYKRGEAAIQLNQGAVFETAVGDGLYNA